MGGIRRGRPSIKGSSRLRSQGPPPPASGSAPGPVVFHTLPKPQVVPGRKKVLFVCIGNSCRSQMAEGFAKAYGHDCIEAFSAGLSPAAIVQTETFQTMLERGIRLEGQYPKGIEILGRETFDIVVNISGQPLPRLRTGQMIEWKVRDPIGRTDEVYQEVADQLEYLVKALIGELRGR